MSLLSALVISLRDDLLITLSVGVGCVIATLCLRRRPHFSLRVGISVLTVFAWMVLTQFYARNHPRPTMIFGLVRYMTVFALYGLSVSFWSKANLFQSLYAVTVSYAIQNMCERLIEIPRSAVPGFPLWVDRLCLAALMAASLWVYYRVLVSGRRGRTVLDFSNINTSLTLFLGMAVVAVTVVLDLKLRSYADAGDVGLQTCLNITSALFSFLIVVVCMSHLRESESERRAEIASQLLYSERRRYEQEKQIHDAINIKCHDIRHQIAALGEEGRRDELKAIDKLINIYDTSIRTQNPALDVVLSGKSLACNSQDITLTCLADGRRMDFMEDSDIYALFGNILDNAIEAVRAIREPEKRIISLHVSVKGDLLFIECENYTTNRITLKDGFPVTTKTDKDYHGYGIRSIRLLTEKYGGDLQFTAEKGMFRLSILLPIPG